MIKFKVCISGVFHAALLNFNFGIIEHWYRKCIFSRFNFHSSKNMSIQRRYNRIVTFTIYELMISPILYVCRDASD